MTEYSHLKLVNHPSDILQFNIQNCICCEEHFKDHKHNSLHLAQKYARYLSLDIICSSKLTVFHELRSRKTARFWEQIVFAGKCLNILLRQIEAIVYLSTSRQMHEIIIVYCLPFCYCKTILKLTVFDASVLLFTMNFVIALSKLSTDPKLR